MDNALQVFSYNGAKVRTVDIEGQPYFVGKDVADVLGYSNTRKAIIDHVDEEDKRVSRIVTPSNGGYSDMTVINESGVYSLIFSSKLPTAKQFKHWVTSEVLPTIRKHGMYLTDKVSDTYQNSPDAFNLLMKNYLAEKEENKKLRDQIEDNRALTTLGKIVLAMPGSMSVKDAADLFAQKGFPIGQNRLYDWCRKEKLTCSRKGKQYNKPTHRAIQDGLMNTQIEQGFRTATMITPKGLEYLADLFMQTFFPIVALIEKSEHEEEKEVG